MDNETTPGALGSNAGLGLLPERDGQPRTLTVTGPVPEAGHWYSPMEVRALLAAERDCRTCTRYTLHHWADVPHCSSPIRCVGASRYERADYVQLWEAEPVDAGF